MGVPPPVDEQPVRQFVVHDATVAAALLVVMSVGPLWTRTVPRTRDGVGTVPEDFLDRLCAVGTEFRQFPSVCSHRSRRRHSRFHRHCQRPISGFLATHTQNTNTAARLDRAKIWLKEAMTRLDKVNRKRIARPHVT